jgi:PPOX class probable F420-dependent enzyme
VASLLDRFYHAIRHPSAAAVGARPDAVSGFEHLRGHKYCLLVTYKRNGEAVPTPVWFGLRDDKVYIRTESGVAKVKRICNDPRARLAPCTARGRPLGPPAEGSARVLDQPAEEAHAEDALKGNYGLGRNLYERVDGVLGVSLVYIEVTPRMRDAQRA